MADHGLRAQRARELTILRPLTTGEGCTHRGQFVCAHRVDDRGEPVHVDQHAVTALARQEWMAVPAALGQRSGAERAAVSTLALTLEMLEHHRRLLLAPAVVAHERLPVEIDAQWRAAVLTGGHIPIIGTHRAF